MQFFIDTANIEEIRRAANWGFLDGVTTNPSLMAKEGGSTEGILKEICEIIPGPISGEVIATDYEGMIKEGQALAELHPNIVVKIPMTENGIRACAWFKEHRIKTNVTLIFSANQALLAAKNGATFVSPFIGRLDDIGQDGTHLIKEIRAIFDQYQFATQILAASIRHPQHVTDVALAGADVATVPMGVLEKLFKHPLTDRGLEQFLADHQKAQ
jgi:transaldolase